ncbi:flagellar protein FliO/FliZ [Andreprevotia lacus DSM 23236]|jgi:flagellar protein FliO/FliZ|uniref:Flagellar protein n=1 Tax=Andreprevotia lacus DSM 23236 TaxID=1121001 RepID=A0A1W1XRN6_9NEIS|nr:flagellar biosynthetic protein FliO [Andreprevotia lacus]SMC26168.1 flagellar protein FliO/FliZ [Andreprevotia lacus DSM 23236]
MRAVLRALVLPGLLLCAVAQAAGDASGASVASAAASAASMVSAVPHVAAASVPLTSYAPPSLAGQFTQVVFALLLVLALVVAAAWLMRRFSMLPMAAGTRLRVVSGVMVGPKERVVIVEVDDTWLVLGVTAQAVNKLHERPRPEQAAASPAPLPPFADWLSKALQRKGQA